MKSDDEIMAEHLLRGGKMLARSCPDCGCPLFEVKGETGCVVCAARGKQEAGVPAPVPETTAPTTAPAPAAQEKGGAVRVPGPLDDELKRTLACLLERVRAEPDPARCRELMKCVEIGWDLLD